MKAKKPSREEKATLIANPHLQAEYERYAADLRAGRIDPNDLLNPKKKETVIKTARDKREEAKLEQARKQ